MKLMGATERTELVTKDRWITTTEEETVCVYLVELSKNELHQLWELVERLDLRNAKNKSHHRFLHALKKSLGY